MLLSSEGQILIEEKESSATDCAAGETIELETNLYRDINIKILGEAAEKSILIINVVGCSSEKIVFDNFKIPENANELIVLKPQKISADVALVNGSFWKTLPKNGDEVSIEVTTLIQNIGNLHIPSVSLEGSIIDKAGKKIGRTDSFDPLPAGSFVARRGFGKIKNNKSKGASLELSIEVTTPVAAGITQHTGLTIVK